MPPKENLGTMFETLNFSEKNVVLDGFADRLADNTQKIKECDSYDEYMQNIAFIQQDKDGIKQLVSLFDPSELNDFMNTVIRNFTGNAITEKTGTKVNAFYDAVRAVEGIQYNQVFYQNFDQFCSEYNYIPTESAEAQEK